MTPIISGLEKLKKHCKSLPKSPGVYHMVDKNGEILYIGKAKNLINRVKNYTNFDALPNRLKRMVSLFDHLHIITTATETEALLLEINLIKKHKPPFNILLRDDKSFPYIVITKKDEWPLLKKHRGVKKNDGHYFGPYASTTAVNETLTDLQKGFLLRSCSDSIFYNRSRPCLLFQIKRCSAPCVNRISKEDYKTLVNQAKNFLKGGNQALQKQLKEKMLEASDNLDYELAARFRDRMKALNHIQSKQMVNIPGLKDCDIITVKAKAGIVCVQVIFFRNGKHFGSKNFFPKGYDKDIPETEVLRSFIGQFYTHHTPPKILLLNSKLENIQLYEDVFSQISQTRIQIQVPKIGKKKELLLQAEKNAEVVLKRKLAESQTQKKHLSLLQELLDMEDNIKRIEVYDNSHISGQQAYGAMIVATEEGFEKSSYRKFKIKNTLETVKDSDDYAMMREVFYRRFKNALEKDSPDTLPSLVIVDGGKGQLSSAHSVLADLGLESLPIIAVAKGPDRNAGREKIFTLAGQEINLPKNDPVLYFIQQIRDESHRYVIGTHRTGRNKTLRQSSLDQIAGIGSHRKKKLLHFFGSAKAVEEASIEDLQKVEGISLALAEKIYNTFHEV